MLQKTTRAQGLLDGGMTFKKSWDIGRWTVLLDSLPASPSYSLRNNPVSSLHCCLREGRNGAPALVFPSYDISCIYKS